LEVENLLGIQVVAAMLFEVVVAQVDHYLRWLNQQDQSKDIDRSLQAIVMIG
jgi:hypothetical protein